MAEKRQRNWLKIITWVLIAVILIGLIYGTQKSTSDSAASETTGTKIQRSRFILANEESKKGDELSTESVNRERLRQRFQANQQTAVDVSQLDSEINAIIAQNPDIVFGVSIKDLGSGSVYNYGNLEGMTAASVTKVLTAVYYLKQVELGNRSLGTTMPNGYSAEYNLEQMIVVSDNDAWHVLNENLGYTNMQNYAHGIGLVTYDYTDNTISSSDTAKLFGDLYERVLINESNTQLLLSYMERANYRDLIIPAVPAHDTVYHKAGEYLVNLNDAAIITNGTRAIVLSIYTESTEYYDKSRASYLMQQITTPALATFQLN